MEALAELANSAVPEPNGFQPISKPTGSDRVGDDLEWILHKLSGRLLADGAALTLHRDDEAPELLVYTAHAKGWIPSQEGLFYSAAHAACSPFFGQSGKDHVAWDTPPERHGLARTLTIAAADDGELRLVITLFYKSSNLVQEFATAQLAKKAVPVIGGYFRLWLHARHQERQLNALRSALDLSDVVIAILDSDGAVVGENSAAKLMFDQADVLRKARRSLTAVNRGDTAKLNAAMDLASITGAIPSLISLNRKNCSRPMLALISPIARRPEVSSDPSFVLCVYDSAKDLSSVLARICGAYNLTKTEARLVELLVGGSSLSETASQMRIAEATARSYLKQIFTKTETNRQSDLIRVMLMSIARTSCINFSPA